MKKQLPTAGIVNELSGASAFFAKQPMQPISEHGVSPGSPIQAERQATSTMENLAQRAKSASRQDKGAGRYAAQEQPATLPAGNHATTPPNHQAEPLVNGQATMPPVVLEQIRKVVKQVGKEAATYRLTQAEKQQLADIVYTYKRLGYRTSDNELARIAINWLILDYQEQGEQSVLARVLETLHR